jgi:hypothetical protein
MIPTSHQLNPASKKTEKRLRREERADSVKQHYGRVDLMPADYLTVHAASDSDRAAKIRAMAMRRNAVRNAKRLATHRKSS